MDGDKVLSELGELKGDVKNLGHQFEQLNLATQTNLTKMTAILERLAAFEERMLQNAEERQRMWKKIGQLETGITAVRMDLTKQFNEMKDEFDVTASAVQCSADMRERHEAILRVIPDEDDMKEIVAVVRQAKPLVEFLTTCKTESKPICRKIITWGAMAGIALLVLLFVTGAREWLLHKLGFPHIDNLPNMPEIPKH